MKKDTQINGLISPLLQIIRLSRALPFLKGKYILDVGCSNGEILKYLPVNIDYIGIEGNYNYCQRAKKNNPKFQFINLYLNENNVDKLPVSERSTIFMLAILEHLDDPISVLKGLKQYLQTHGRIIITTPSKYSRFILESGSNIKLFMREMDEHKHYFSKEDLFNISEQVQLKIKYYRKFEFGLNNLLVLERELT